MRISLLGFWGLIVSHVAALPSHEPIDGHTYPRNVESVDEFLGSIGVDQSTVPFQAQRVGGCTLACAILVAAEGTQQVVTPYSNATEYIEQADSQWSATAYQTPLCVFTPQGTNSLRIALLSAQFTQCKFAVRSGGHSPNPGWANINGGLLISLKGFTDLTYDEATQTQRSGMGNNWGDIYAYMSSFGRLVVGGRLNSVGLGLATGGGLSHLSNEHGWVSQNVITYEVMLANGSVVMASATENPDLYHGVKAANNNFGVVTHLIQRTVPMKKVWGGQVTFSSEYSKDFMAAMAEFQLDGQLDAKASILPYLAVTNDTILASFVYLAEVERPDAFAPFYLIPNTSDSTQIYDSFYDFANAGLPDLPRWTYGVTTVYLDSEAYVGLVDVLSRFISRVQEIQSGTLALMAQPISKSMVQQSRDRGDDPMNVTLREQLWATVNIGWSRAEDDSAVYSILEDCVAAITEYAQTMGVYGSFQFLNDAFQSQQPLQSYGTGSYGKLKSASLQYDPSGVFQHLVPGGFKL